MTDPLSSDQRLRQQSFIDRMKELATEVAYRATIPDWIAVELLSRELATMCEMRRTRR